MKTLNLAVAAVVVMSAMVATPAMASTTATWGGTTGTFNEGCAFQQNVAGQMSLSGNTWTVNNPALIRIKTRNVGNISIESDNRLRTTAGVDVDSATVNYTGTTVTGGHQGGAININPTSVTIGNLQAGNGVKVVHIQLRGTASMSNTDELSSTTAYKINHTITCTQ